MLLWCNPCFDLGLMRVGFLQPVECIKDCLPVIVSEVVLDLVNIHVCRSKPICGREFVGTGFIVTATVQKIPPFNLKRVSKIVKNDILTHHSCCECERTNWAPRIFRWESHLDSV